MCRPGIIRVHTSNCHPVSWVWINKCRSQLDVGLIRKIRGFELVCLAYLFYIASMGVCTTYHWHTPGRLVQELNVCTVLLRYGFLSQWGRVHAQHYCAVPAHTFCTKHVGSPGILHDRTPDCHPVSWARLHG